MKNHANHAEMLSNMKKKQPTAQSSIGKWLNDEAHHTDEPASLKKQATCTESESCKKPKKSSKLSK